MDSREVEEAKKIALTIFPDVDYDRTMVVFIGDSLRPIDVGGHSLSAPIIKKGGYELAYLSEIDMLCIRKAEMVKDG